MKKIVFASLALWSLTCCENPIRMETTVHEDGSLDKTIVLEKTDKSKETSNMFGISQKSGWTVLVTETESKKDSTAKEDPQYTIEFKKSFTSAEAVNHELNTNLDTLFGIQTKFEKRFKWFYTYITYSETFHPINRFKKIEPGDYFTQEDKSFLDRLPGEGTMISKADSLYLEQLNQKIYDRFTNDALFNEFYSVLREVVQKNTSEPRWLDLLATKKDFIYKKLEDWDGDLQFALETIDSIGITLPRDQAEQEIRHFSKDINSRVSFMSSARDARYTNIIEMPWTVVSSNADSVAGNKLYYRPLPTKFAIQGYTMFAQSRQLNTWTIFVSVFVIGITIFVVTKSHNKKKT